MSVTVDFSEIYARAAKHLNIDVSKFEVKGEKLKRELGLKYHKAFVVYRDTHNVSTPFPMNPINKISSYFRRQIIFQDLPRRDNKRNYTITEPEVDGGSSRKFIFVVAGKVGVAKTWKDTNGKDVNNSETIKTFLENQVKERAWIDKCLSPVLYSSIKQAEIKAENISSYGWVESEEVELPIREVSSSGSLESYRPTFLRSKGNFRGERSWEVDPITRDNKLVYGDSPIYLYTIVDRLDDVSHGMNHVTAAKMHIIEMVTGWIPVLLSKSKKKYFENSTHKEMSDELFIKITSTKENIAKLQGIQNSNIVDDLLREWSYNNTKHLFPRFITEEFKVRRLKQYNQHRGDIIVDYVDGVIKKDLVKQWDCYFTSLVKKYPVLSLCKLHSSYQSISHKEVAHVNMIIDMLEEKEKEKSFSRLSRCKREKVTRFQNKNKRIHI